jgi:hypothetical protein
MGTLKYIDDELLNYNQNLTDTNLILQEFNNIKPNLQFTMYKEQTNKINFIDILIQRTESNLSYNISKCMDFPCTTYRLKYFRSKNENRNYTGKRRKQNIPYTFTNEIHN